MQSMSDYYSAVQLRSDRWSALRERLAELERVVLAPHLGSATREAREAMAELVVANVEDLLEGRRPRTRVEPPRA